MTLGQALVLGIVQGLTEFLPISSSAHLVLVPWVLGWTFDPEAIFVFNVLVQGGTLLGVLAYFRRDLWELGSAALLGLVRRRPFKAPQARLGWLVLLATLPAAVAGVLLKSLVEKAFASPLWVSGFLLVTAAILELCERSARLARDLSSISAADALWIGLSQVMALFPGISRSGATIAGGLLRGLTRAEAARFSFLMVVPVMIGANLVALGDLTTLPSAAHMVAPLAAGFLAAAIVGFLSIQWLLSYLMRRTMRAFAIYCALVGSLGLLLAVARG